MNVPIDELYFTWLYEKVGSVKEANPTRTYWALLKCLFTKEFVWLVANDDNRAEDGRDLRYEFLEEQGNPQVSEDWHRYGCSILELLIAIARRIEFEANGGAAEYWFWVMIENLELNIFTDKRKLPEEKVNEILDAFIWRTYNPNGKGGLFPLNTPDDDQRDVEIWYQLNAWLIENELLY